MTDPRQDLFDAICDHIASYLPADHVLDVNAIDKIADGIIAIVTPEQRPEFRSALQDGDYVRKVRGYSWPGKILSVFLTEGEAPAVRYTVRCIAPGAEGALHIFAPEQIERGDPEEDVLAAIKRWLADRGMCVVSETGNFI